MGLLRVRVRPFSGAAIQRTKKKINKYYTKYIILTIIADQPT